jgi:1-acyl-sn-glycerol-3-phosphate acyltransferase
MAHTSAGDMGEAPRVRSVPDLSVMAIDSVVSRLARLPLTAVPPVRDVLFRPLPFMGIVDRALTRAIVLAARRQVRTISGLENILSPSAFILAANHTTRREAIAVPAMLIFHRGGRLIHFWSDWVFRLVPGLGLVLRRAGTIVVTSKPARPRALNFFRRFFADPLPAIERARSHLEAGRAVGVFPEGTINRDRRRLLAGRPGAARLSLETGVPVVPVGIRFPDIDSGVRVPEHAALEVCIGAALVPPRPAGALPTPAEVWGWHATIMTEIARLSGKTWQAPRIAAASGNAHR